MTDLQDVTILGDLGQKLSLGDPEGTTFGRIVPLDGIQHLLSQHQLPRLDDDDVGGAHLMLVTSTSVRGPGIIHDEVVAASFWVSDPSWKPKW